MITTVGLLNVNLYGSRQIHLKPVAISAKGKGAAQGTGRGLEAMRIRAEFKTCLVWLLGKLNM